MGAVPLSGASAREEGELMPVNLTPEAVPSCASVTR